MLRLTSTLMFSIILNQIDDITVEELNKVVSDILSDPLLVNKITTIMSQQVVITIRKTIQAACQQNIETLCKKKKIKSKNKIKYKNSPILNVST